MSNIDCFEMDEVSVMLPASPAGRDGCKACEGLVACPVNNRRRNASTFSDPFPDGPGAPVAASLRVFWNGFGGGGLCVAGVGPGSSASGGSEGSAFWNGSSGSSLEPLLL